MEKLKKIVVFFAIFAVIVGMGCGIGMNFYHGETFSGVCCIVLSLAAVPTVLKLGKYLLGK